MTNWVNRFDDRERKLENDEPTESTYSDSKEKINVVTEEEEEEDAPIWSGLYCIFCHDLAVFIYKGDSICHECYNKEVSNLIRDNRK